MRKPDLTIGPKNNPQTLRWQLFKWRGWQVCLHRWLRSDDDRALHDHSGHSFSIPLTGRYIDIFSHAWEPPRARVCYPFMLYFRPASQPHRVFLYDGPMWSLWFRFPPIREWGFHCPKGWRHWKEYLASRDNYYDAGESITGPGCG